MIPPVVDIAIEPATPLPEPQLGGSYRRNADGSLELVARTAPATGRREAADASSTGTGTSTDTPAAAPTAPAADTPRRATPAPKE